MIGCRCEVCTSTDTRDKRFRTSLYVESAGKKVVFDTGPDFRMQMLNNGIDDLDAVIFTHNHKDHTAGLDDIRPINFLQNKCMDVYAELNVQHTLRNEYAYIFNEKDYPGIPRIQLNTISEKPFKIDELNIIPIRVWHMNLPVLGFRIGNFTYITDANRIEEEERMKMIGTEVLVINALRHTTHYSHFSLEEALAVIEDIQPQKAYLTHISHQLGLHSKVSEMLPKNVFLAYDGLTLEL